MLFVQTSTLPPRMHPKLTKHERCCLQNNQLLTKVMLSWWITLMFRDGKFLYTSKPGCDFFDVGQSLIPSDLTLWVMFLIVAVVFGQKL